MTIETTTSVSPNSRRLFVFWFIQMLVIASGIGWTTHRYQSLDMATARPILRNEPLRVNPLYDVPEIVSDSQLRNVLLKLRPRLRGPRPNMNFVDHALRFWGIEAHFADPEFLSGVEMRDLLLDHRQFTQAWGTETRPFLIQNHDGIQFRTQQGAETASHLDHTLASLAEAGVPLDFPVITAEGEAPLRLALEQSLRDFSLNQWEYEWSTLAYALYMPETKRWMSKEGQEINFDRLADRLMRQRLAQGVCRGNHRLHALVMLLRVDEQIDILSHEGRERIIGHLQDTTSRFVQNQHEDGYWDDAWPGLEPDGPQHFDESVSNRIGSRLLVTGHVLEWWALAPAEIQPPRETLTKAGQWLAETIDGLSRGQVNAYYTYLTHAGRALSLWRGQFPAEVSLSDEEPLPMGDEE